MSTYPGAAYVSDVDGITRIDDADIRADERERQADAESSGTRVTAVPQPELERTA